MVDLEGYVLMELSKLNFKSKFKSLDWDNLFLTEMYLLYKDAVCDRSWKCVINI